MAVFLEPDTWTGGSVELLAFYPTARPCVPRSLLREAWSWVNITGPYGTNEVESEDQSLVDITQTTDEDLTNLYGVARLPNGLDTAFSSTLVVDDDGHWLYMGVPLGALGRCYPVGAFPFDGSALEPWALEVYAWLNDLAQWLFSRLPFAHGAIGWLTTLELDELVEGAIPSERYHGYLRRTETGLEYLPPNASGPVMTAG